jgi:uncharacterized membrane protein
MAARAVRERLAHDLSLWLADGLISVDTNQLLRQRYGAGESGLANAIRSLAVAGALILFFGLLGLVAALSGSKPVAAFLLAGAGAGVTVAGIRLSMDKLGRYALSSGVVLMLGVVTAAMGIGVALDSAGLSGATVVFAAGAILVVPVGILAYWFRNTLLLIIGLLGFFHWVGSWSAMFGRSTYELAVQDPRWMSLAALAAIVVGVYHERSLRDRTGRFFQAWEAVGLIYLNVSMLILTVDPDPAWGKASLWIALWLIAGVSQIAAGARLHNPLLTGFGVTAFAVNVYTRYYETFWNRLHAGTFFLLGGLVLLAAGLACEIVLRRSQRRAA